MKKDELFRLGKIVRAHGSKGEVIIQSEPGISLKLQKEEPVFISFDANLVPFFIEEFNIGPKAVFYAKFSEIDSIDDCALLLNHDAFIPISKLPSSHKNRYASAGIEGFRVVDSNLGHIGNVKQVIELTYQSLLSVDFDGTEVLIPIVDEIVTGVDNQLKIIFVTTPEGLLGIYK